MFKKRFHLSKFKTILLGYLFVILIGAFLLSLPISSINKTWTSFINSLFTSTSAVCVTGLVVFDTATHWSVFGQIIILLLIQIGGMGVITVAISFIMLSGKKIGLFSRDALKESISAHNVGGIASLTKFILKGIFLFELLGAIVMMPFFCKEFGWNGIWMSIFHSISAFCNAGFDIMGKYSGEFSSLTMFSSMSVINIVICLLIVIGGIGFIVWKDICDYKFNFKKYRLQSKVVIIISIILIILPGIYFFFFEFNELELKERILVSMFQAITPRTAGFNTINLNGISEVGLTVMIILMLVGGSPGSTAGGMKTSTIAVIFASIISVFRNKENAELFKKRISDENVKNAFTILFLYLFLFLLSGLVISKIENIPVLVGLFETASAIGTVGLTLGITPTLCLGSKIILIILMFFGRLGGLTLIYATLGVGKQQYYKYPMEKIIVG